MVAANFRLLGKKTTKPTREEIIAESGLARSTAYEVIKRDAMAIHAALKEAQQVCLVDGAEFGTAALILSGIKLYHGLLNGRDTRTITSQELAIMVHCAEITGFIVGKGSGTAIQITTPDGTKVQVAQQGESPLDSVFSQLGDRWRGTEQAGIEHVEAEKVQDEPAPDAPRRLEAGKEPGPLDAALVQLREAAEHGELPRGVNAGKGSLGGAST